MQRTLKEINRPDFLHLLLNADTCELALSVCRNRDKDAIRVHYGSRSCDIYSVKLMKKMVDLNCKIRENCTYKLTGQISQNKQMVIFRLDDAVVVER